MTERVWLTWETQRRNRTTSAALGARLFEMDYRHSAPVRYLKSIGHTMGLLMRHRPKLVLAQNPSIVLAALVTRYGRLTRTPVVIDAHNAGIFPFDGKKAWANALNRNILRSADATIVTNEALAEYVENQGGRALILPDPMPQFTDRGRPMQLRGEYKVLFVCTWAEDEPYLEVLAAAERLPPSVRIYITGKSKGREREFGRPLPENVELTGFVSEDEFVGLLHSADLIMDLTTREDCLVCGAYEGVAAGRPLLLSGTRALRSYFHRGAVYTDNTAVDLADRIEYARAHQPQLEDEVRRLKQDLEQSWRQRQDAVLQTLATLERTGRHRKLDQPRERPAE